VGGLRDIAKSAWHIQRSICLRDAPSNPVVFCGIARPQKFLEQLKAAGITPAVFKSYRDHHAYSAADVQELLALRDRYKAQGFVTTGKDAINLGGGMAQLGRVAVAQLILELMEPADALDTMLRVIAERRPLSMRESLTGKS
jgi:tetraacyldisaccharide 4'-kinase